MGCSATNNVVQPQQMPAADPSPPAAIAHEAPPVQPVPPAQRFPGLMPYVVDMFALLLEGQELEATLENIQAQTTPVCEALYALLDKEKTGHVGIEQQRWLLQKLSIDESQVDLKVLSKAEFTQEFAQFFEL